jgi:penicillin-binding protein-related factor A (putative recombinase)
MSSPANRGKAAEKLVKTALAKLALQADTASFRLPDARAGSLTETLADFLVCYQSRMYLLEVKETEHLFRLPHGNFDTGQVARMRRFELAGALSFVLVYHSKLDRWRFDRVERFAVREGGSWDLRDLPLLSLDEVLQRSKEHGTTKPTNGC